MELWRAPEKPAFTPFECELVIMIGNEGDDREAEPTEGTESFAARGVADLVEGVFRASPYNAVFCANITRSYSTFLMSSGFQVCSKKALVGP